MDKTKTKRKSSSVIFSAWGMLAIAAFSPLFLYFRNAGEAHFREIVPTLLGFMAVGAVLFALFWAITRSAPKAGIITALFLVVFLNYAFVERGIQSLLPSLRYWHIAPILLVLLLHLAWLIWKKLPDEIGEIVVQAVSLVVTGLILFNGIIAIPSISVRISAEQEAEKQAQISTDATSVMPNFYFILFDELSTVPVVKKYFNYDNSDLLKKLEELGFTTSQSGHNESASTAVVTANLFNLDYLVTSHDTEELKFSLRSNNEVFQQLREAGYTITGLGNASFYGLRDALESQPQGATTVSGENIGTILLKNTVIYPYLSNYYPEVPRAILKNLAF